MKVSFIVPVYNCKHLIQRCISSIKRVEQCSHVKTEIVLIDDGSTDGSFEVCENLGDVVIHQENQGVSTARNAGINIASGDYLVFVDADDYIDSEKYSLLFEILETRPEIDVLAYGILFDYYKNRKFYRRDEVNPPLEGLFSKNLCLNKLYSLYEKNVMSPVWNKIIKTSLVKNNNLYFNTSMFLYEDLEFSLRLLSESENWYFVQSPVYHYIQVESAGKSGNRLQRVERISAIVDHMANVLSKYKETYSYQIRRVCLSLYETLAVEKIAVSDIYGIKKICTDCKSWIDKNNYQEYLLSNGYLDIIYNKKVNLLLTKKFKSQVRHKMAITVKSTIGDFRKWPRKK